MRLRRSCKTPSGDGGHAILRKAIDAHANFSQYVPLALLLLLMLNQRGIHDIFLHLLALPLLLARACHAYGISQVAENINIRTYSMIVTITVLALAASGLLLITIASVV